MKEWLFLIGAIFLETFATSMLKCQRAAFCSY